MKNSRFRMARIALAAIATAAGFPASNAPGHDMIRLWPDGETPHAKEADAETGRPYLLVYPAGEANRNGCGVVVCPGGGYGGLAADHEGHQIARWLNSKGITAFVLHYRLGSRGHHFPTQLADVQRAIRFARSDAPPNYYEVDPSRIGVWGFSAGGHLASMAATKFDEKAYELSDETDEVSARPDFAVLCYPVISMEEGVGHMGSRRNLLGPERANDEAAARHVSSDLNVTAETPPTFLFHTGEDTVVPGEHAIRFYLALRKHGVRSEIHIFQRGPHGVGLYHGDPILGTWSDRLFDWIRTNGFLAADFERTAVEGTVTLDEVPVGWGNVTFRPADPNLPETTIRIRNGKFQANAENGPVIAESSVSFAASIYEAKPAADEVRHRDRLSPGDPDPLTVEVKAGMVPLAFELKSE